jgi:hypothetical protein
LFSYRNRCFYKKSAAVNKPLRLKSLLSCNKEEYVLFILFI